jgi:hypothetical protein
VISEEVYEALRHAKRNKGAITGTSLHDGRWYMLGVWLQGPEPFCEFMLSWAEFREAYRGWQWPRKRGYTRKFERVA